MRPKRAFYLIIGVLLVVISICAFAYVMADRYLSKKATEISALKADLDIVQLQIANTSDAVNKLNNLQDIQITIDSVLPPDKIQSEVVVELVKFANEQNLVLSGISFQATDLKSKSALTQTEPLEGVPGVNVLPITVSVIGDYNGILGFLNSAEQNQRKMQIDKITLSPDKNTGLITATIIINVYVRSS